MIKNLKYMDIEYTKSDLDYIDYVSQMVDSKSEEVLNFFELDEIKIKSKIKIYDDLEKFRNAYVKITHRIPKDWICGVASANYVNILTLNEYKKTETHEDGTVDDLIKLIIHEFVHTVQNNKFSFKNKNKEIWMMEKWLSEGAATYLSGQYDDINQIKCTYEELLNGVRYGNYKSFFTYVLEVYGKDFIFNLMDNGDLLKKETPKLFEEAKNALNIKKK